MMMIPSGLISKERLLRMVSAAELGVEALEDFCRLAGHLSEDMAAGLAAAHKGLEAVRRGLEALP